MKLNLHSWVLCMSCGTYYQTPMPIEEEMTRFYRDLWDKEYRRNPGKYPDDLDLEVWKLRAARDVFVMGQYMKTVNSVLDFGCAAGYTVKFMRAHGLEADGVEPSEDSRRVGRELFGVDIYPSAEDLPNRSYDLLILSHVLEHVLDPVGLLSFLQRRFSHAGGLVYIECPNIGNVDVWHAVHLTLITPPIVKMVLELAAWEPLFISEDKALHFTWGIGEHSD